MFSWFAVQTKARHEFKVNDRLQQTGIDAFLPTVEKLQKWKDRNKLVHFPVFPGYLFIHIKCNHNSVLSVLKTKGVVKILGTTPDDPEPIPEEQIIALKRAVDAKTAFDPYPYLQEGHRVRIKYGPLAGIEGILVDKAGQHKLVVSVDILRQSTAITINTISVERV